MNEEGGSPRRQGQAEGGGDPSWGLGVKVLLWPLPGLSGVSPRTRSCPGFAGCLQARTDPSGHCRGEVFLGRGPDGQFRIVQAGSFRKTG